LPRASDLNFECLDILRDSIGHPSKKLLLFEFATSFRFQFGASRYITGLNGTSEYEVIDVWNCSELLFSILSVSINYGTQSDIREKSYCRLNLQGASIFNFEYLNIWRDSAVHPNKKLLSFEFATSFRFQSGASRYITHLNRTSEYKVIVVWNCSDLLFSISSVSIYYPTQPDIRVKIYCRLNMLQTFVFN